MDDNRNFGVMVSTEFSKRSEDIKKAIKIGLIYMHIILSDPETGLVPAEKHTGITPELKSFINKNKIHSKPTKLYYMDKMLFEAYKLQKIANDYISNKNTRERKVAELIESNLDMLSREIKDLNLPEDENKYKGNVTQKFSNIDNLKLATLIETLSRKEITKKVNGLKISVTGSNADLKKGIIPVTFYVDTNQPLAVFINLCYIYDKGGKCTAEFENDFRREIFNSAINEPPEMDVLKSIIKSAMEQDEDIKNIFTGKPRKNKHKYELKLKIYLKGIKPLIWRRILISSDITLHDLHLIIQAAFGWENYHLYQFTFENTNYSVLDDFEDSGTVDSRKIKVKDLYLREGDTIDYVYDLGDEWHHVIKIEKISDLSSNVSLPACMAGKRNCPPEDSGGPYALLENKGNGPTDNYDPEWFDLEIANRRVMNYKAMDIW